MLVFRLITDFRKLIAVQIILDDVGFSTSKLNRPSTNLTFSKDPPKV